MNSGITGHTRLLALFGAPVAHSGSPAMHNFSFQKLGLDYVYLCLESQKEDMERAFANVRAYNMPGGNITMPCKTVSVQYMDELSPAAELIGAVNTFVQKDGHITGHNTDGIGFVRNLKEHGIEVAGKKITVCGAGGAATAILAQCALDGAKELVIFKRKNATFAQTQAMAERIGRRCPDCSLRVLDFSDEEALTREIRSSDILVNATSVGMKPNEGETVVKDKSAFYPGLVVCDAVYNPLETRLLREAKECGCICVGGKGMLLWQGVEAFKLFTGCEMPVEEVKAKFYPEL